MYPKFTIATREGGGRSCVGEKVKYEYAFGYKNWRISDEFSWGDFKCVKSGGRRFLITTCAKQEFQMRCNTYGVTSTEK